MDGLVDVRPDKHKRCLSVIMYVGVCYTSKDVRSLAL